MSESDADDTVSRVTGNYQSANLDEADVAMLDYAARLTGRPWEVREADIEQLREHGFDDRAIHDLCSIVAYFAFANRIASGLGIKLESEA